MTDRKQAAASPDPLPRLPTWCKSFEGLEWTCPKCGGSEYHIHWYENGLRCGYDPPHPFVFAPEGNTFAHHHRTCRTCQYAQAEFPVARAVEEGARG